MVVKIDTLLISMILACFVIGGSIFVITDLNNEYDLGIEQGDFGAVTLAAQKALNGTTNTTEQMRQKLLPNQLSFTSAFDIIIGGAYNMLSLIWSFFSIPAYLITTIAVYLNVPPLVVEMISTLLTISILFGIVYLIFKMQPR